ncbi:MAG: HD domain-containing protein [Desulforegulaceae bacterium]|nr:HD domain-containing protein [Desulforegulaceae bacterium]
MWSQDKYLKALNFASKWHLGQKIPGSELPYIIHPVAVAMEIIKAIPFEHKISEGDFCVESALLHDVLEDTEATYSLVLKEFGKKTADGVLALTKNKDFSNKKEAMKDSLERIKNQPFEIWLVKIADRISNLYKPPSFWTKIKIKNYFEESLLILEELGKESCFLSKRLKKKIETYKGWI